MLPFLWQRTLLLIQVPVAETGIPPPKCPMSKVNNCQGNSPPIISNHLYLLLWNRYCFGFLWKCFKHPGSLQGLARVPYGSPWQARGNSNYPEFQGKIDAVYKCSPSLQVSPSLHIQGADLLRPLYSRAPLQHKSHLSQTQTKQRPTAGVCVESTILSTSGYTIQTHAGTDVIEGKLFSGENSHFGSILGYTFRKSRISTNS